MTLTPDISDLDWVVLQETHAVEGVTTEEVWTRVQFHNVPAIRPMIEPALLRLSKLGLIRSLELEGHPLWSRTDQGDLVYNWRTQLTWDDVGPEPRPGETGNKRAASAPCDHYRPCHGLPNTCWCGWYKGDHAPAAHKAREGKS